MRLVKSLEKVILVLIIVLELQIVLNVLIINVTQANTNYPAQIALKPLISSNKIMNKSILIVAVSSIMDVNVNQMTILIILCIKIVL